MINLLSGEQKGEIRAARLNVQLRKYVLLSFCVALGILVIYGVGFYFVMREKANADSQLSQDTAAVSAYQTVQKEAKDYKANLTIANKVLSSGISYSGYVTEIAHSLPPGSILTDLTLSALGGTAGATGGATNPLATPSISLHARTNSYDVALKVKDSLEASPLFENASITEVNKTNPTDSSTPTEKKYPFTLSINVSVTKQKVTK